MRVKELREREVRSIKIPSTMTYTEVPLFLLTVYFFCGCFSTAHSLMAGTVSVSVCGWDCGSDDEVFD